LLLAAIQSGRLFSLHREIHAFLYIGALFIVAGVGGTVKRYFLELGPAAILSGLTAAFVACLAYCFRRARTYAAGKVESPTAAFDYILYLACALLGVEFAYLEAHYHLLDRFWDYYFLVSAGLFFWLAYRFDNRLVLALALANLAAWFGIRFWRWDIPYLGLRTRAILFGAAASSAGKLLESFGIKAHFTDTYFDFGLTALFWALLSGIFEKGFSSPYLPPLVLLSACVAYRAYQAKRFKFFLYAVGYGYLGFSICVLKALRWDRSASLYLLVSASALIVAIFAFRRAMEERS
jgi:hypothetical protein